MSVQRRPGVRSETDRQDTAKAIRDARLVILLGVGHDLPREAWPQVASEVRALADRAMTSQARP